METEQIALVYQVVPSMEEGQTEQVFLALWQVANAQGEE